MVAQTSAGAPGTAGGDNIEMQPPPPRPPVAASSVGSVPAYNPSVAASSVASAPAYNPNAVAIASAPGMDEPPPSYEEFEQEAPPPAYHNVTAGEGGGTGAGYE